MSNTPVELTLEESEWTWLKPHLQRNALFWVSPSLNLLEVGKAVMNDSAGQVQKWIQANLVTRPSDDLIQKWEASPQTLLSFVIVQPYILLQEKTFH